MGEGWGEGDPPPSNSLPLEAGGLAGRSRTSCRFHYGFSLGLRSIDIGGRIIYPTNDALEQYHYFFETVLGRDGRDMRIGRRLGALLRGEGFTNIQASASFDCHWGPQGVRALADAWVEFPFLDEAVTLDMADDSTVKDIRDAFKEWKESPDAFFAWSQCQVVGMKE